MAKLEQDLHKKLVTGLGNHALSPAVLAQHMMGESLYVNETLFQYMVNYIIIMATRKHVPLHLESVNAAAKNLYCSLQELGLTGTIGRESVVGTEFLAV